MTYKTDLNRCKDLIKTGSHSFYAASKLLPGRVRNPALILYAFCRLADDAIDNSVPAIKAMNTALEMAQDSGNDELAKMIEKDLRDAKLRLDTGKDLNQVKFLQDKYSKFMPTEGLAYESKLAIMLNQQLK